MLSPRETEKPILDEHPREPAQGGIAPSSTKVCRDKTGTVRVSISPTHQPGTNTRTAPGTTSHVSGRSDTNSPSPYPATPGHVSARAEQRKVSTSGCRTCSPCAGGDARRGGGRRVIRRG